MAAKIGKQQVQTKATGSMITREDILVKAQETCFEEPRPVELTSDILDSTEQLMYADLDVVVAEGISFESFRIPAIQNIGDFLQVLVIQSKELIRERNEIE